MHNLFGLAIPLLGIYCIDAFAQVCKSVCVRVLGLMVKYMIFISILCVCDFKVFVYLYYVLSICTIVCY